MPDTEKQPITFDVLWQRLAAVPRPEVDCVVGILRGGRLPAAMVAQQFDLPLFTMRLSFRDDDNRPLADEPQLVGPLPTLPPAARVLLVDDVAVTGRTFERAKSLLPGHAVTTLACKGTADVVLLPEVKRCVRWPWSVIELK